MGTRMNSYHYLIETLLTGWLGFGQVGLAPFPVRTHWVTTPCCMRLLSIPRLRVCLGATGPSLVCSRRRSEEVRAMTASLEQFVQQQLQRGKYESYDAMVQAGLRLLKAHEEELDRVAEALRPALQDY